MKHLLPEYFQPSDEDIKRVWENGTIVLDANVLLNLFRYSENSRNELIKILQFYKNRLWVPYQVAFEFLENCLTVPASLKKAISDTLKACDSIQSSMETLLGLNKYDKYHLLKPEELRKEIAKFQERLRGKVEKVKKEFEDIDRESILETITSLLEGKVGDDFDEKALEDLFKEGEKRYKDSIPPGYKDLTDKKGAPKRHLYGDLIWWKQSMDYAKTNHSDLVIITDDAKEDWWYKVDNETKSPRVELVKEFRKYTGQAFHMCRTSRFMELSKKFDKVSVSSTSIKEVKSSSMPLSSLTGLWPDISRLANEGLIADAAKLKDYSSIERLASMESPYSGISAPGLLGTNGFISAYGSDSSLPGSGLAGISGETAGYLSSLYSRDVSSPFSISDFIARMRDKGKQ